MSKTADSEVGGVDGWLIDSLKRNGRVADDVVVKLCEMYLDWLEDDGATFRGLICGIDDDGGIEARLPGRISHFVRLEIEEDWSVALDGVDRDEYIEKVIEYYHNNDEFKETIQHYTKVVNPGGGVVGMWDEVYAKEDEDEEEEEMKGYEYGKVQEAGIWDRQDGLSTPKVRGTMIKFARDIDEFATPTEDFDRHDILTSYNRWMLDRIGSNWARFIYGIDVNGALEDEIVRMWADNDEFKQLIEDKHVHDPDELEGNGESTPDHNDASSQSGKGVQGYGTVVEDDEKEEEEDEDTKKKSSSISKVQDYGTVREAEDEEDEDKEETIIDYPTNPDDSVVIHGDAVEVTRNLERNLDALIMDPPYGKGYDSNGEHHDVLQGDADMSAAMSMTEDVLKKSRMLLNKGSPVLVFCSHDSVAAVSNMVDKWYNKRDIMVWDKQWIGSSQIGGKPVKWRPNSEFMVLGMYGKPRRENPNRHDGNVLHFKRMHGDEMKHPTQKPMKMMRYLIESLVEEDRWVYDPFAGSGSTLLAAKQTDRNYVGVEIDDDYYELIQERLQQNTLVP